MARYPPGWLMPAMLRTFAFLHNTLNLDLSRFGMPNDPFGSVMIMALLPGVGNGFGIEMRSSVDTGVVTDNVLTGNTPPQLVVDGMNFTIGGNQLQ